jgi:hypothetical protein
MTASGPALIWVFWAAAGMLLLVATTATLWPLLRGGGVQAQRMAWVAAVALPLLAATLYHRIGAPAALGPDALPASPHRMNDESMVAAIELLTHPARQPARRWRGLAAAGAFARGAGPLARRRGGLPAGAAPGA